MDLDKSINLLNESISKRGLIRSKEYRKNDSYRFQEEIDLDCEQGFHNEETTFIGKQRTDNLYTDFLQILQKRANDVVIFDTVSDLAQTCTDMLNQIGEGSRKTNEKYSARDEIWLTQERNTWNLLYCLYKDRITNQKDDMDVDEINFNASEKQIIEQLYLSCSNLREYQLVVDWLEQCCLEQGSSKIGHYTDRTIAWENTIHHLQNCGETVFGSGRKIVKHVDPDAPLREKLPLHDLDNADDIRLARQIFLALRQGRFDDAQSLCEHCGQSWRAALLEGWRLHHDPNYYDDSNPLVKIPIEGNPKRDIWKKFAWMMADSKKLDEHTRAISGVFCGHLNSLLSISNNWDDLLWSYLKVQIDIRVESEIRSNCMKKYIEMPEQYWNGKMSLEQIFSELSAHKNVHIQNIAKQPINVIQKCLILDNITELLKNVDKWLANDKPSSQMLRFLTHIILFMRQIRRQHQEDIADKVIKAYVESIIKFGQPQLVAFYTAALPREMQIILYSQFLETITDSSTKKVCLEEAISAGLDFEAITTHTVENVRNRCSDSEEFLELQDKITPFDEKRIEVLEWLIFYPQQRHELLWQTNAFIRNFMAERKMSCVRKCFEFVPKDSIQVIISNYGSKEDLPYKQECSFKEFLSYQAYLAAMDGYNDWTFLFHSKPVAPQPVKSGSNFTEKIAAEHKENAYRIDLESWEQNLESQTSITKDLLYNILLFPENGWLCDAEPNDINQIADLEVWHHRSLQLNSLRQIYIPEIVMLLHNVLHLSENYKECIRLADELVNEQRQIYKCYAKHKLAEILSKIAESSLALMNENSDPWGYGFI